MRVVWTHRARQRLKELEDYIAKDKPTVARRVVRRLILKSRQLDSAPRSGRQVPEYQRDDVRELLVRPYRIIYRLRTERIDVLTVRQFKRISRADIADIGDPDIGDPDIGEDIGEDIGDRPRNVSIT